MNNLLNYSNDFMDPNKVQKELTLAPKRPQKQPIIDFSNTKAGPSILADSLLKSADPLKCLVCEKNIEHMNDIRRMQHINTCLDEQERMDSFVKKTEKWTASFDCPLCDESLPPGLNRATHAKRCAKMHNIEPSKLVDLMDTQSSIADSRKKRGLVHTSCRQPTADSVKIKSKNPMLPKTHLEEKLHIERALSVNVYSDDIANFAPQKRPKLGHIRENHLPFTCRCAVIDKIQQRFAEKFRIKQTEECEECRKRMNVQTESKGVQVNLCFESSSIPSSSSQMPDILLSSSNLRATPSLVRHRSQPVLSSSSVAIFKTDNITPMPDYSLMNTPQLHTELDKFGVRKLGKRRALQLLTKIYETTHPNIDADGVSNDSREDDLAEQSAIGDVDAGEEEHVAVNLKDSDEMTTALLDWFRLDVNSDLLDRVLALQSIPFEDIYNRAIRAENVVSTISKRFLADFLDKQNITFTLPAGNWKSKKHNKTKKKPVNVDD